MKTSTESFFELSDGFDPRHEKDDHLICVWYSELEDDASEFVRVHSGTPWFTEGGRSPQWNPQWYATLTKGRHAKGPPEDAPLGLGHMIFSDRLRTVIDAQCPGGAQFLPVRVRVRSVERPDIRYWIVNTVRRVDASHPILCKREHRTLSIGLSYTTISHLVLSSARVPHDCSMFIQFHASSSPIVRGHVRDACIAAGITGLGFRPIESAAE